MLPEGNGINFSLGNSCAVADEIILKKIRF
jgi:hypothetical protein